MEIDSQPIEQVEEVAEASPQPRLEFALSRIWVVYVLMGLNVLIFVLDQLGDRILLVFGALVPVLVLSYGQWWRILTAGFLHFDLAHIAFNMLALYNLGRSLERFWGTWRFVLVYGLALLGSSACVTLFQALEVPGAGASGALMGIVGAQVIFFWRYRNALAGGRVYLRQLLSMAAVNIGIGFLPGISLWGHLGGFIVGGLAGLALLPRYELIPESPWRLRVAALSLLELMRAGLVVLALVAAFVLAVVVRV